MVAWIHHTLVITTQPNRCHSTMARRRRKSSASSLPDVHAALCPPRVVYARRKKPESWLSIGLQVSLVAAALALCLLTYFYFDLFHYHLTHFRASKWDDHHAQHLHGHRLLRNRSNEAFEWFRRSADRGHPHSAYNLAAGHLSGYRTDVKKGEVRQLLRYAAKNGVDEAKELLRNLCKEKPKYCDI